MADKTTKTAESAENLEDLTVPELKEAAAEAGLDIPSDAKKAEIVEALEEHESDPANIPGTAEWDHHGKKAAASAKAEGK